VRRVQERAGTLNVDKAALGEDLGDQGVAADGLT
jgi:hypothetical protein